jgi:hypothetical protein
MKKLTAFILALVALSPSAALAQVSGYLGADGFFSIRDLEANKNYAVNLGGMPIIRAGTSNSCGILRVAAGGTVKQSDRIEIKDEKSGNIYGFENSLNIPTRETQRCDGQIKSEREIWKDSKGNIYISGLNPSSAQTIRLLSSSPTRTIKANVCGFLSFKLGDPRPGAIIINNQAFVLANVQSGGGIVCRKGKLYVAYPPQPTINPIAASTWSQQNPISWSPSTQIASISGSGSSWSPPSNPNPNPGSGNSCTIGVNCDPPPPPPPTCPEGTIGTPPNCQTPPPPTCPEGTIGTPPNCQVPPPPPPPEEPPEPKPPTGQRYCKVGSQFVVLQLVPGKDYWADEDDTNAPPRKATATSQGRAVFDNINFNKMFEGEPAGLYVAENEGFDNTIIYANVSVVQPCQ